MNQTTDVEWRRIESLKDIGRDYWPMVRRTLFSGRVLLDDSLSW